MWNITKLVLVESTQRWLEELELLMEPIQRRGGMKQSLSGVPNGGDCVKKVRMIYKEVEKFERSFISPGRGGVSLTEPNNVCDQRRLRAPHLHKNVGNGAASGHLQVHDPVFLQ